MHRQTREGLTTVVWRKKTRGGRKNIAVRAQNGRRRKRNTASKYYKEQKRAREALKREKRHAKLISKGKMKSPH